MDMMDQAVMFADSTQIRSATIGLKRLAAGEKLEDYQRAGMRLAGRYLKAVGIVKPPTKPVAHEFATRAVEGRPIWYTILSNSIGWFREAEIADAKVNSFLRQFERFLLSIGKTPVLTKKQLQLGIRLLNNLSDNLLLESHPQHGCTG